MPGPVGAGGVCMFLKCFFFVFDVRFCVFSHILIVFNMFFMLFCAFLYYSVRFLVFCGFLSFSVVFCVFDILSYVLLRFS